MTSPSQRTMTPLAEYLAERIRANGPITFAEYMRECLYHPQWGYYLRDESQRLGDFYTSVDVHPIFGRLLARQLDEMWRLLGSPENFCVAESAAATGRLAAQILDFAERELPDFYGSLHYVAVEVSPARRQLQPQYIGSHLGNGHAESSAKLPDAIPVGCILSNELLDALPVHRVLFENGVLRESYVGLRDGGLVEEFDRLSTAEITRYFQEQGIALAERQIAEVGLEACGWIEDVGRRLHRGFVITIDYGYDARDLYSESRNRGTVMVYANRCKGEDFLQAPGELDMTAHVNFTALDLRARGHGLARTGLVSQMQFLVALGRGNEFGDLHAVGATEVEKTRDRLRLKTLISPEDMGEYFRVFIQHKGIDAPRLTGLLRF